MLSFLPETDEIISETPINRLNKSLTPVLTEAAIDIKIEMAEKSKPFIKPIITDNYKTMTGNQALATLAKKQNNGAAEEQSLIVPVSKIVERVKKTVAKIDNLEDLEKAVRNFDDCALKKMATNTVFADGDPKSKVMIIGEAPGNHEDLQGIPFCGDSGKLLNEMFAAAGFPREKIYITNSLFWRPPGNRRPTEDELAMCKPFVEKHIELIAPKLIVLMGATAMYSVLGIDDPIGKIRGKFLDYSNPYLSNPIKSITLFHPSYLMRQSSKKRLAWADMIEIRNFLQKVK
jgi:DNA polymerase